MQKKPLILALLAGLALSGAAQATLTNNGGGLIYDSVLNITWLQNANLAATNTFGVSGINAGGSMNWNTAQSWIGAMNAANYLGQSDWMLPTALSGACPNCTGSAMGELFYTEGGLTAGQAITDSAVLTSDFSNMQAYRYWSGTEYAPAPWDAWYFDANVGEQGAYYKYNDYYAWAVLPGNVGAGPSAVPEPSSVMLVGLALAGLGAARRKVS